MVQMGNQPRAPGRCPALTAAPRRGHRRGKLCPARQAVTFRCTATELPARRPDFLRHAVLRVSTQGTGHQPAGAAGKD